MNRSQQRERYLRDSVPVRLGNLASSLGRLATCAPNVSRHQTVLAMLDECKRFIEWTGPDVSIDFQPELVRLQVELARWRLRADLLREDEGNRRRLSVIAREWSQRILIQSGVLG